MTQLGVGQHGAAVVDQGEHLGNRVGGIRRQRAAIERLIREGVCVERPQPLDRADLDAQLVECPSLRRPRVEGQERGPIPIVRPVRHHRDRFVGVVLVEVPYRRAEADEPAQEVRDLAAITARHLRLVGKLGHQHRRDEPAVPARRIAGDPQCDVHDLDEELMPVVVALGHAERGREELVDEGFDLPPAPVERPLHDGWPLAAFEGLEVTGWTWIAHGELLGDGAGPGVERRGATRREGERCSA